MLATVLMLAVAQNIEPTRAGIAALILAGPNPIRRLWAFLLGIYTSGLVVGVLVLFVFHRALVSRADIDVGKVQIGIGVATLLVAAVIALNLKLPRSKRRSPATEPVTFDPDPTADDDTPTEIAHGGLLAKLLTHSTRITNNSPTWVLFVLGLGFALPSIDFMALLLLIAASAAPAVAQIGTLMLFLTVGNLATVLPLVSHRLAPEATLRKVEQFQTWLRARSRRDVAMIVAAFGLLIIAAGAISL